ncbi:MULTISPECIES: histidine phosphatase family protein [Phenylobacterium]|uniref:Phosphoglycerate mutase n=1 Tax=Phenylobacterium koreense TaxID=266125 RepID=A0ABV2EGD9_9CAUL
MIYLVRHGETVFNAQGRQQGRLDSPLTAQGRAQAAAVGRLLARLVRKPADWRLVASPLGRAQATASIIGETLRLPVETDPRVIEISFGEWDGRLRDELALEYPKALASKAWRFAAPGGETYQAVHDRLADWMASLPPEPDRKVIVVSHGGSGRVLRGAFLGLSPEAIWDLETPQDAVFCLANGSIVRFDCQPAEG